MACCIKCFLDQEVIGFITTESSAAGNCHYCSSLDVIIIDPIVLEDFMFNILNSYTNHPTTVLSTGIDAPMLMHEHIKFFWPRLFNHNLSNASLQKLLFDLAGTFAVANPNLFSEPVELKCFLNPLTLDQASLQESKWLDFTEEIKSVNRFFLKNAIDLDILAVLLDKYQKIYPVGTRFFRSRLAGKRNFSKLQMGKPPSSSSKAGRANPTGIPYLYLAHDKLTTVYEARASLNDKISIATFTLKTEIKVMSLTDIMAISPLLYEDDLEVFALHRRYMQRLSYELSRPIHKNDSELDYLPTQYLCEYIKFCDFDAVEYQSSLNPNGVNIALFDDSKAVCTKSKLYQIDRLDYTFDKTI